MNPHDLQDHKMCGLCIKVWANGKPPSGVGAGHDPMHFNGDIFMVDNLCPECKAGDLDFARRNHGDGRWAIEWKAVPCPVASGPIKYILDSGTNRHYQKIRPTNVRWPIAKLGMKKGGKWEDVETGAGHYGFVFHGAAPSSPELRVQFR